MAALNTNYLRTLEAEAIYVLREAAAQFSKPVILFSGGKDSICLVHLAIKAFYPCPIPFEILHIDTGHNFEEVLEFRNRFVRQRNLKLLVRNVSDTMRAMNWSDPPGKFPSRNVFQSRTLLDAINELELNACIGGARRDEEKARAKERVFSHRNKKGEWKPALQRPELWNIFNGRIQKGEHFRVFPLSNWTELDVWNYIQHNKIELPSIYYSHLRECLILPGGQLLANSNYLKLDGSERVQKKRVRFRTVGDMTCTAAVPSIANNAVAVIKELKKTKISERGQTRLDDAISETGMEDRKRQGYF